MAAFFHRTKQVKPEAPPIAFNLNIEPLVMNYGGQNVELLRKKMCEKFGLELQQTTGFDYLLNWVRFNI